jgi:hypothetical protein
MSLPRTIATAIDGIARQAIGKDWNLYAALLSHWPEIVGQDYARNTTPVKISFPKGKQGSEKWTQGRREGGTLHVHLPQGLVMEFTFHSEQIRQRIAAYFGYDAIGRIVPEPYYGSGKPLEPPPAPADPAKMKSMREAAKSIEDDDLRGALEALGESVLKNTRESDGT